MRTSILIISSIFLLTLYSCQQSVENESADAEYSDLEESDNDESSLLIAVTDEEHLQYGARVAFVDNTGDTIIPFGNYAYFGTDTLIHYANVLKISDDNPSGKPVAINSDQEVLFDLVLFDNGPDPVNEGLMRVSIDGKMGYANTFGEVVIPCVYDYAKPFENGVAEVTFKATVHSDGEHKMIESEEWFSIDKQGQKIK